MKKRTNHNERKNVQKSNGVQVEIQENNSSNDKHA